MKKIGIIGGGIIGSSWALLFARAGREVSVYDHQVENLIQAKLRIETMLQHSSILLHKGEMSSEVLERIHFIDNIKTAVEDSDYVQEAVSESLELKKTIFSQLDALTKPSTILASSTSTFGASLFTDHLSRRERCLVVHPLTPPHLMPIVEMVRSTWTTDEVLKTAFDFMYEVGQEPVLIKKEVSGFVLNRLQGALLTEMFDLISKGVISPTDADLIISKGLGLRWSTLGPLEGIDLNAPNGIQEYLERYGHIFNDMAAEKDLPLPINEDLIKNVSHALRAEIPLGILSDKRDWRDQAISKILVQVQQSERGKPCS